MGKKRKFHLFVWCWICFVFGLTCGQDIKLQNPNDGFFIKKLYDKNDKQDPNTISKTFVINEPSDLYKLQIRNGPFESHQTIPRGLLEAVHSKSRRNNSLMHRNIVFDMDVSAHIVSTDISPKLPRLQVLVHAVPHVKGKSGSGQNGQWCVQIFVDANDMELSSVCILNEKDQVCVAGVNLPKDWWSQNGTALSVSYSFVRIDQNNHCASASNSIIPEKVLSKNDSGVFKQHISRLHIVLNEESYEEWKDQDILIDVPREMFHNGDTFEIPIRLEAKSDLQVFTMRARVRQGLRITGARMTDPSSQWSIHVDIKDNQKTGTVTAFVRDAKVYMKSRSVQDVFRWQMEVAEDVYDTNTGRIVWSIEYTRNGIAKESYLTQDSKIVSQINIHNKDQQRLVPVLKVNEILNLAILNGREQVYPLQIFAVDNSDRFKDVTQQTKCHSVEVDVLKVAADCSSVYVDGAESRGSHNVTIIAKSSHVTAFMDITVWIPEDRLNIQLSDDHLSRIKNWKVEGQEKRRKRSLESIMNSKDASSKHRNCELQRQQAIVEVYTRFYIQTPKVTDYFMGSNAYLKVTDLVQSRLRMSDTRIATLSGNMIKGQDDGRTEIQVLSPRNGYVLAAKEIRVGHDKLSIKRLSLKLITDLQLYVMASDQVEGALVATAVEHDQLLSKYQEGIIDVVVEFTDMTSMPLRLISPKDYFLEVMTTDHNVISLTESKSPHQAQIVALSEGSGDLIKINLKLPDKCRKRKSKSISTASLFIDVDFSQERRVYSDARAQKDAHYDTNRASDRWDSLDDKKPEFTLKINEYENKDFPETKFSHGKFNKENGVHMIAIKDDLGEIPPAEEGTRQEPLQAKQKDGLSDLEIGMYVLVAVFCVAITVFTINCVVFFVRYKRKQKPKQQANPDAISSANDWVWIGRATLERNSVYTRSSRTLMPEEDFNGNHTRPVSTSSSESSRESSTPTSAPNSNRNSTVSTYKGSECSIRITTNPLTDEGAVGDPVAEQARSEGHSEGVPQWDYEAMGMNYDQLLEYFDNLKESMA